MSEMKRIDEYTDAELRTAIRRAKKHGDRAMAEHLTGHLEARTGVKKATKLSTVVKLAMHDASRYMKDPRGQLPGGQMTLDFEHHADQGSIVAAGKGERYLAGMVKLRAAYRHAFERVVFAKQKSGIVRRILLIGNDPHTHQVVSVEATTTEANFRKLVRAAQKKLIHEWQNWLQVHRERAQRAIRELRSKKV